MKKYLLLMMAIFLLVSVFTGCSKDESAAAPAVLEKVVAVEIETPKEGNISQSLTISGKLEPVNSVTVIPEINGLAEIKDVRVKLGDLVKEGDVLFTIDNESIQDQIENLRLSYETTKKNYEKAKEGFENAKMNLARNEQLYQEGAISQQQFEQSQLTASDLQLDAMKAQLDQAEFAYTNNLKLLNNAIITAPIGGYVSSINIEKKGMASAQPSLVITDISTLEVEILVTEGLVHKINKGQEIYIEIPSIGEETIKGIVTVINPVPDPVTQLYKGKIGLDNPSQSLRPGMFAKIYLDMDEKNSVITIPSVSVMEEDNAYYVYVVVKDRTVKKEVKIGMDNGEIVEILSGISKDDGIVVKGQDFVVEGSKVKVVRGEE